MLEHVNAQGMDATFRDLELSVGLRVQSIRIRSGQAQMKLHPFSLEFVQPGTVEVVVTQEAVADMLSRHSPKGIGSFKVEAQDGKLYVSAKAGIVSIKAIARMEIEDGNRLVVKLEEIGRLPGPVRDLVAAQVEKNNPLVETDDWPFQTRMEKVVSEDGLVTVYGQLLRASE